jgi:hypothetical protein
MIRSSGMFAKNSSGIHYHMLEYRNKDVRDQPALRVTEDYDLYPTTLLWTYQRATLWTCSTIRVSSSCAVPQRRSWPDRKDPVYSCFFLLLGEKFIGNSSNIHWEFIALCFNEAQGRERAEVVSLDEAVHQQILPWHWSCSGCGDTLRGRTYLRETILRISGAI